MPNCSIQLTHYTKDLTHDQVILDEIICLELNIKSIHFGPIKSRTNFFIQLGQNKKS